MMKIALLATGDELTNGDILNTNGQTIAQHLFDRGFVIGNHMMVSDEESEIITAIHYLLQKHDVIIMTGGLGPTSDDRTRFALAKALDKDLFFHQESWEKIVARLAQYNLKVHDSNKQQAYFPKDAEVILNPHGTANGCIIEFNKHMIFMLPGPPKECLPMFHHHVLPILENLPHEVLYNHYKWCLFGVSEGEIAAQLDAIVAEHHCITGYRWNYPYLEFKLHVEKQEQADVIINKIEEAIAPHIICTPEQSASKMLRNLLKEYPHHIAICDQATGGLLEYKLTHPQTRNKITFTKDKKECLKTPINFLISGLTELWNDDTASHETAIKLIATQKDKTTEISKQLPLRGRRIVDYTVEYLAFEIRKILTA